MRSSHGWDLRSSSMSLSLVLPFRSIHILIVLSSFLFIVLLVVVLYILYQRQRTYRRLKEAFGTSSCTIDNNHPLPIVYWYPKISLWNHHHHRNQHQNRHSIQNRSTAEEASSVSSSSPSSSPSSSSISTFYQQYVSSSNITNVLPRMLRLNHYHNSDNLDGTTNEKDVGISTRSNPYHMYGTVYGIQTPVIHIAHPTPIQHILVASSSTSSSSNTNNTTTHKNPAYNHFHSFCGRGVFTTDGNDWSMKRHAVLQALFVTSSSSSSLTSSHSTTSPPKKSNFIDHLEHECHTTATRLIQSMEDQRMSGTIKNTTTKRTTFNIVPLFQRATLGLIYRYLTHDNDQNLFHKDHVEHDTSTAKINSSVTNKNNPNPTGPINTNTNHNERFVQYYLHAITNIRMNILAKSRSIWYMLFPSWIYRYFGSRVMTLVQMEQTYLLPPIQQMAHVACRNAQTHSPLYKLLQNPIYHSHENYENINSSSTATKSVPMTPSYSKNIIDETITLLFAGQDTTAATLSWTIHLLTLYPHVQHRLYQEICTMIEQRDDITNNDDPSPKENRNKDTTIDRNQTTIRKTDVTKMKYLDAVIKESMRLYPVAPFIVRNIGGTSSHDNKQHRTRSNTSTAQKDDTNIVFPKPLPNNSLACIWIYSLHRHPTYWSKPDEFIPERWLVNHQPTTTSTSSNSGSDGDSTATSTPPPDLGISTPCAYIPYAIGSRNCLGQPMANIILRILLCRLMYAFEFIDERVVQLQQQLQRQQKNNKTGNLILSYEQIKPLHKEMQAGFTILPLGGLELSVKPRR